MILVVHVYLAGPGRPPVGSAVRIQVRDTSLEDVEAPLVAEANDLVVGNRSKWLATTEIEVATATLDPRTRLTVFVHVDVDGDGAISTGDFITTQSYSVPISADETDLKVLVSGI